MYAIYHIDIDIDIDTILRFARIIYTPEYL